MVPLLQNIIRKEKSAKDPLTEDSAVPAPSVYLKRWRKDYFWSV